MSNFDAAVAFVLHCEDETDTGQVTTDSDGVTKWGICSKYHPDVDVPSLSREDASAIYKAQYWREEWDALPPGLAVAALDCSVNQGPVFAQTTLDSARHDLTMFLAMRLRKYSLSPRWETYGLGWTRRVLRCMQAAVALT